MIHLNRISDGQKRKIYHRKVNTGTVVHVKLNRKPEEIKSIMARARQNAMMPTLEYIVGY